MTISTSAPRRRATMLRPTRARGGWHADSFFKGETVKCGRKSNTGNTEGFAARPAYLGLPGAAKRITLTANGYRAEITDDFGRSETVGVFADAAAALEAARRAFVEAAANV